MIIDKTLEFCVDTAIPASSQIVGDTVSLKPGEAPIDVLDGEPMVVILCTENGAGGTSVDFELETSNNQLMSSPKVVYSTGAILLKDIKKGAKLAAFKLPRGLHSFMAIKAVTEGVFSGGKISAFVTTGDSVGFKK